MAFIIIEKGHNWQVHKVLNTNLAVSLNLLQAKMKNETKSNEIHTSLVIWATSSIIAIIMGRIVTWHRYLLTNQLIIWPNMVPTSYLLTNVTTMFGHIISWFVSRHLKISLNLTVSNCLLAWLVILVLIFFSSRVQSQLMNSSLDGAHKHLYIHRYHIVNLLITGSFIMKCE